MLHERINIPDGMEIDVEVYPLIYFVSAEAKTRFPIKIGRTTTKAAHKRIASLQTGMPYKLEYIMVCQAAPELEGAVHRAFADIRLKGEWFKRTRDLTDFIAGLEEHDPDWRDWLKTRLRYIDPEMEERLAREAEERERAELEQLRRAMDGYPYLPRVVRMPV